MLPVSRFSIDCVVLCPLLLVFFFLLVIAWSMNYGWYYTFGVLDIFIRNKHSIPHTWLYLRFCSLLIYVILVHTIIVICTRASVCSSRAPGLNHGIWEWTVYLIWLFVCFYCFFIACLRLASCVLNVASINIVHSWLPLRFFLTFIWFWWISNTSSAVSLLHKAMHIESTYPEAVFWKAWTLT